jgi:hypothetical protein
MFECTNIILKMELTTSSFIKLLTQFCVKYCSILGWTEAFFEKWVEDHLQGGRAAVELNFDSESGYKVEALGFFRFVDDIEKTSDEFYHVENGEILWVDLWVDEVGKSGRMILESVLERCNGNQKKFAYVRPAKDGEQESVRCFGIEKIHRFATA